MAWSLALQFVPKPSFAVQSTACVPSPVTAAVHVKSGPAVSESGEPSSVHVGLPLIAAVAVTVTVTGLVVFQPFEPFGVCVTDSAAGVVSDSVGDVSPVGPTRTRIDSGGSDTLLSALPTVLVPVTICGFSRL